MSDEIDGKSPNQIRVEEMEERMEEINSISPTMCTAKWLQSTLNLHNGHTHSCHHPPTHKIAIEDIAKNPAALHNTPTKKGAREQMLNGERPKECQYCWNIEDLEGNHFSDRTYKSADVNWSTPFLPRVLEALEEGDVNPSYMEVAFDYTCNFKCAYCSPDTSSKWMEEITKHGAYPTSWNTGDLGWLKQSGKFPINPRKEENPYVEAFWKWWPTLYPDLDTFRVTGGEPLLSKEMWKILEFIEKNPRPDLNLAINTNLNVPDKLIDKLIGFHNRLDGKLKSFEIFTSCEAVGEQAEYSRYGMDYEVFMGNVRKVLENTNARVNFMITFNILSISTFEKFLEDIWNLRVEYNETDAENYIPMMIAYLRWPRFMSMKIAPRDLREKFAESIKAFIRSHARNTSPNGRGRFYIEEIDQVDRLCDFMLADDIDEKEFKRDHKDFSLYFQEYDKRRGTNLMETFPELEEFYLDGFEL